MFDLTVLKQNLKQIEFREKRPGIYKVLVPFFYEDGDMYDVFLETSPDNSDLLRISDHGLSLMKLSYAFDIDTEHKKNVLDSIVVQNRAKINDGEIYMDILPEQFQTCLYQMAQVVSKVNNMDIISKETAKSYFYELLKEFVCGKLHLFGVEENYQPLSADSQLIVDYKINVQKPIFLYGVNDDTKASKVIINCLNFQKHKIPFRSLIVHDDFEKLTKYNKKQITNATDKQFYTLDDFTDEGLSYMERELAAS